MFLNLKGRDHRAASSRGTWSSTWTKRPDLYETAISFETRVTGPKKVSSTLVGNLGNDLMQTSALDYWTGDEKAGT